MAYISFQPNDYFNTKLYTGTGAENAVTGVGFQPDFTWLKNRATTNHHTLFDAVRGANKVIYSNLNAQEYTVTQELKSFDSDGFTVGTEASANGNGNGIASWNWKANGAGSSNTDGSITSTVSANTTSGFSIVTYTGTGANATIGHGLGSAPSVVICKQLNATQQWINYHNGIGATKYLHLNDASAAATSSTVWNDTEPTSSVFSVGTAVNCNGSGNTYIAYCFAEKTGFSKFGSYVGNGNVNGAFIYTGFKPKFVMTKYSSGGGTGGWLMYNGGLNTVNKDQFFHTEANTSAAWVDNTDRVDFLSNGFKFRDSTNGDSNTNGGTYIYMAFAEAPLVGSNNVPATAR